MVSYDPADERIVSKVIYTDALAFVVSPKHRFAKRKTVSISELGMETFIAHNVVSPYREVVVREFRRHKVPLNMDVEMPTLESIRKLVQSNEGVAFLPRMCVRHEVEHHAVCEVKVKELHVERMVRLLFVEGAHAEPRRAGLPGRRSRECLSFIPRALRWGIDAWVIVARFSAESANDLTRRTKMLWTIAVILLVLWALGLVSSFTMGGFIHLLLVAAVVVVAVRLIQGRSPV